MVWVSKAIAFGHLQEHKAACNQQLSDIIQGKIGHAFAEGCFAGEGVKNQDDIGSKE